MPQKGQEVSVSLGHRELQEHFFDVGVHDDTMCLVAHKHTQQRRQVVWPQVDKSAEQDAFHLSSAVKDLTGTIRLVRMADNKVRQEPVRMAAKSSSFLLA